MPTVTRPAVLAQIEELLPTMTRKRQRLGKIVLESPELIAFGSARDVAAKVGIDAATIVRFAQSLGYSGFGPFKGAIRRAYLQRAGLQPPRVKAELNESGGVVEAIRQLHLRNVEQAYDGIDPAVLDAACERLINAKRIFVCAEASASVVSMLFLRLLRHVGLKGEALAVGGVDRTIGLHDCTSGDVVVGISLWLTYQAPIEVLMQARRQNATTIAITGTPSSPFSRIADYAFIAPAQGVPLSFSVIATAAIAEAIIAQIASKRIDTVATIERDFQRAYVREGLVALEDLA